MKLPFLSLAREWKELLRFKALDRNARSIVFYAEDAGSWPYLEPIVGELTGRLGRRISYITSSANDPILRSQNEHINTFCVGYGSARTALFLNIDAGVMVMTMPDLGTFHIKRSRHHVHYAYVHHSMISTHMAYRRGAFDDFDAILCVGPHHSEEIRATEKLDGLTRRKCAAWGSSTGLSDEVNLG